MRIPVIRGRGRGLSGDRRTHPALRGRARVAPGGVDLEGSCCLDGEPDGEPGEFPCTGSSCASESAGAGALLCRPPGPGKTPLAERIAKALGRPAVNIALGGVWDEAQDQGAVNRLPLARGGPHRQGAAGGRRQEPSVRARRGRQAGRAQLVRRPFGGPTSWST